MRVSVMARADQTSQKSPRPAGRPAAIADMFARRLDVGRHCVNAAAADINVSAPLDYLSHTDSSPSPNCSLQNRRATDLQSADAVDACGRQTAAAAASRCTPRAESETNFLRMPRIHNTFSIQLHKMQFRHHRPPQITASEPATKDAGV